jgi:MFS family permease
MSQAATQRRGGGGSGAVLSLDWYRSLSKQGTYAFWASSMGWALDAFDYMVLSFSLVAISATLSLSGGQGGFLATATLVVSAIGGVLAGMLADRIGRARTLMITIAVYSLFTFLAGLSQSYEQLLACRALQGLGFGGEWAVGAILVSELADPEQRGRLLGAVQSSWAVGWGLCAIAYTVIFSLVSEDLAWRVLFCLGIVPGLLVLYIRRFVKEPPVFEETQRAKKEGRVEGRTEANPLTQIFRRDLLGTTAAASLLPSGRKGATTQSSPGSRPFSRPSVDSRSSTRAATFRS